MIELRSGAIRGLCRSDGFVSNPRTRSGKTVTIMKLGGRDKRIRQVRNISVPTSGAPGWD